MKKVTEVIFKNQMEVWKKLSNDFSLVKLQGKVPIEPNWSNFCQTKRDFNQINFHLGENAGIATGPASGIFVVDVDDVPKFQLLITRAGLNIPHTKTIQTGSGKFHLYYQYPHDGQDYGCRSFKDPADPQKKKTIFDIKGKGGQVVAPGSIHPNTGKPYEENWSDEQTGISEAPQWVLDLASNKNLHLWDVCNISETEFRQFFTENKKESKQEENIVMSGTVDINTLPLNDTIKKFISEPIEIGSRSEPMMAVLVALAKINLTDDKIINIFENYPIGEKFREKKKDQKWLINQINKARVKAKKETDKKCEISTDEIKHQFGLTDYGNACRFVKDYGENMRYCTDFQKWYVWNKMQWEIDEKLAVHKMAKETIYKILKEAAELVEPKIKKEIRKHALNSQTKSKTDSMISLAKSEKGIPIRSGEFDKDDLLFNIHNCTIDLRTGKPIAHNRADLITKISPVTCSQEAKCPRFEQFLYTIMKGNPDLVEFLQRVVGYSLTGKTNEECFFILYGTGRNGKSTFLEILKKLLGQYAKTAEFSTFIAKKNDSIRNDIARLDGARFLSAAETNEQKRLDEALVKTLTGRDTITARMLYKEAFEFIPKFKIFLAVNHKPVIKGNDDGIWRRIKLIPFEVKITDAEVDCHLLEKLTEELPGILNWAIEGCLKWQKDGLKDPQEISLATQNYRVEMDCTNDFLEDRCNLAPNAKVAKSDLYGAYVDWCKYNNEDPVVKNKFGSDMKLKNFKDKKEGNVRYWLGIALNDSDNIPDPMQPMSAGMDNSLLENNEINQFH